MLSKGWTGVIGSMVGALVGVSNTLGQFFNYFNAHGFALECGKNGLQAPQGYAQAGLVLLPMRRICLFRTPIHRLDAGHGLVRPGWSPRPS